MEYLGMLTNYEVSQIDDLQYDISFQQDGTPS